MNAGDIKGCNRSQRGVINIAIVLGVAAIVGIAAVTLRFVDAGTPAASAPSTTTTGKPSTLGLGVLFSFARADDGRAVATLIIYEVVALPGACLEAGGEPGHGGLAVRYEVDNPGSLTLSIEPNNAEITTIDKAGVSHHTRNSSLAPGCRDYPAAASAAPGRKTAGWVVVTIVPSRDMVIIRMGVPMRIDPANPVAILTGSGNPDNRELYQRISAAVTDIPAEPYVNPYATESSRLPIRNLDDLIEVIDPVTAASILLGVGPYASSACNILWCNGKPVPVDVFRLLLDVSGQLAAAITAAGNAPR